MNQNTRKLNLNTVIKMHSSKGEVIYLKGNAIYFGPNYRISKVSKMTGLIKSIKKIAKVKKKKNYVAKTQRPPS